MNVIRMHNTIRRSESVKNMKYNYTRRENREDNNITALVWSTCSQRKTISNLLFVVGRHA